MLDEVSPTDAEKLAIERIQARFLVHRYELRTFYLATTLLEMRHQQKNQ